MVTIDVTDDKTENDDAIETLRAIGWLVVSHEYDAKGRRFQLLYSTVCLLTNSLRLELFPVS